MIWFFRYCYYGVYQFNKRKGWERPDENAFVWMALSRGLIYGTICVLLINYYDVTNNQINRFWGTITLTTIELFISTLLNGRKKHVLIEKRFYRLTLKVQTLYTCLGLLLFPIGIVIFLGVNIFFNVR